MKKTVQLLITLFSISIFFLACSSESSAPQEENTSRKEVEKESVEKESTKKVSGLQIGDTAPDFKLKNVDGRMVSLADYPDAKGFIITFTCNHCPYSVLYEDRLIELHNELEPKGYPVIAINPNNPASYPEDSYEQMQVRAKEKGFHFVYLFDDGQKVYPQYGATRTPHMFVLDKDLKVQYIGAVDDNSKDAEAVTKHYVRDAILALEKGEKPDPAFTKAIGCSIKK